MMLVKLLSVICHVLLCEIKGEASLQEDRISLCIHARGSFAVSTFPLHPSLGSWLVIDNSK